MTMKGEQARSYDTNGLSFPLNTYSLVAASDLRSLTVRGPNANASDDRRIGTTMCDISTMMKNFGEAPTTRWWEERSVTGILPLPVALFDPADVENARHWFEKQYLYKLKGAETPTL